MSIQFAILGILSCYPQTGYDVKKIMQDSPFMYWSGNNNQIYKVLLELHQEGYVRSETIQPEHGPSKKIYTVTQEGMKELKRWALSLPEAPQRRSAFLMQLAWAGQLKSEEILRLLEQYEQDISGHIAMIEGQSRNGLFRPDRTPREAAIWDLIQDNVLGAYRAEAVWAAKAKETIGGFPDPPESGEGSAADAMKRGNKMQYQLIEKDNRSYILLCGEGKTIQAERDALDLLSICMENDTNRLLLCSERISDEFLRLSTGIAGAVLQKFTQYNVQAAAVIDPSRIKGKFRDFLAESNNGPTFRAYTDYDAAEAWLLGKP